MANLGGSSGHWLLQTDGHNFLSLWTQNYSTPFLFTQDLLFPLIILYPNLRLQVKQKMSPLFPTVACALLCTIICQVSRIWSWSFQFLKLITELVAFCCWLSVTSISFIWKVWQARQASQHEASLPPLFSTFLWQILSRSRPQILKYFKQKPQLNSPQIFYFNIHFGPRYVLLL